MNTFERYFICSSLFLVMMFFYSCSDEKEIDAQYVEQSADKSQEAEIQELIEFIDMLNVNLGIEQVQTRGRFWDRIRRILLGDALGGCVENLISILFCHPECCEGSLLVEFRRGDFLLR